APEADTGETVDIVTPAGGESVTEGTILEWAVKVGDTVADGDTVVEISTDKVDMELPAPASGTIAEILVQEGDTVTVGQVIARMTADPTAPAPAAERAPAPHAAPAADAAPATDVTPATDVAPAADGATASPIARRVAAEESVDLSKVQGTARGGRITKADVIRAVGDGAAAPAPSKPAAPAPSKPAAPAPSKPAAPAPSKPAAPAPSKPAAAPPGGTQLIK